MKIDLGRVNRFHGGLLAVARNDDRHNVGLPEVDEANEMVGSSDPHERICAIAKRAHDLPARLRQERRLNVHPDRVPVVRSKLRSNLPNATDSHGLVR